MTRLKFVITFVYRLCRIYPSRIPNTLRGFTIQQQVTKQSMQIFLIPRQVTEWQMALQNISAYT